jgi:hypothetical protein
MHTPDLKLGERGYELAHVKEILVAISRNLPSYWVSFAPTAREKFRDAIAKWEDEHPAYLDFLDPSSLEEYDDDPNAFKGALRSKCPIVRRSLNSPAEEMKKYKKAFNLSKGRDLLTKTLNIVAFGEERMKRFDERTHERTRRVEELCLSKLLEEDYVVYGVVGGGIRSHFLYSLYPNAFPNRSRAAVWALYFLSGKDAFGFSDGSEFLMIDVERSSTQQNYHYPYDLFAFYCFKTYRMLKNSCSDLKITMRNDRRYVYLDAFFNHVHDTHEAEIALLKGSPEDEYAD